ncbi:MAG: hypothetical protein C0453_01330 [Comamonadaceae bacterium]|nr:hypothetical protein [Comamonadaceae bacterium]
MSRSSIQGTNPAPAQPAGRDTASLGPGDTSDSGSDLMGLADSEGGDPDLPTDIAFRDDQPSRTLSPDTLDVSGDAVGTGESRSAGADGGRPDGWDIGADQVYTPDGTDAVDNEDKDPDLAFIDDADAGDPLTEDAEDEAEDADASRGRRPSGPRP